jgi:O-acetyl-ADP-ribose deacetylase (regulator of RNase III)
VTATATAVAPFLTLAFGKRLRLECVVGDLLNERTEAIACPDNSDLTLQHGLARRIAEAAGPHWVGEARIQAKAKGILGVGCARLFNFAGRLHQEAVVHIVPPLWIGEAKDEFGTHDLTGHTRELLTCAVYDTIRIANDAGLMSIALPALGFSGSCAIPAGVCAPAYLSGVRRFANRHGFPALQLIRLVVPEGPLVGLLTAAH